MFASLGFLPANVRNQKHPFRTSSDSWANGCGRPHQAPCGFLVVAWSLSIIIDGHSPSPFTHFLVLAKGFSVACHLWPSPILILMLNIWPGFESQSASCAEFKTLFVCRFDAFFTGIQLNDCVSAKQQNQKWLVKWRHLEHIYFNGHARLLQLVFSPMFYLIKPTLSLLLIQLPESINDGTVGNSSACSTGTN